MWDPAGSAGSTSGRPPTAPPRTTPSSPRTSTAGPTWPSVIRATRPRWAGTSATSPSPRAGSPARARAAPAARGIWYEGTAHLADALEIRGQPGDAARAARYLSAIYHAQARGPGTDGRGVIAASAGRAPRLRRRHPLRLLAHGDDGLVHPGRQEGRPFRRRRPARVRLSTAGRAATAGGRLSGGRCRCAGGAPAWPGSRPPRPGRSSTSAGAAGPCPGPRCGRAGSGCCRG